jgi:rare lipoprotein A
MKRTLAGAALAACLLISHADAAETFFGTASWYGPGFHGRQTANGERYDQNAETCAHKALPFGTVVRVTNLKTRKIALCRINDRGPYHGGRVIDVSREIASDLDMIGAGTAPVRVDVVRKKTRRPAH